MQSSRGPPSVNHRLSPHSDRAEETDSLPEGKMVEVELIF